MRKPKPFPHAEPGRKRKLTPDQVRLVRAATRLRRAALKVLCAQALAEYLHVSRNVVDLAARPDEDDYRFRQKLRKHLSLTPQQCAVNQAAAILRLAQTPTNIR